MATLDVESESDAVWMGERVSQQLRTSPGTPCGIAACVEIDQ